MQLCQETRTLPKTTYTNPQVIQLIRDYVGAYAWRHGQRRTAARSGEVRGARWDEIDLDSATWTIPAEGMKAGKEHRVPLSAQAMEVLARAREYANGSELVFPGPSGRAVTSAAYSKLLHENDIGCVPHGFRSSFRDWCSKTGQPRELAEHALAHVVKGVEGAYQRSDLFNRRRALMAEWTDHVTPEGDTHASLPSREPATTGRPQATTVS